MANYACSCICIDCLEMNGRCGECECQHRSAHQSLIFTANPEFVARMKGQGIGGRVLDHVSPEDVAGRHVYTDGRPLLAAMAAVAASVTVIMPKKDEQWLRRM